MNNIKQYHSTKICYNWEHAREETLADNYVSVFNFNDFFYSNQLFELKSFVASIKS